MWYLWLFLHSSSWKALYTSMNRLKKKKRKKPFSNWLDTFQRARSQHPWISECFEDAWRWACMWYMYNACVETLRTFWLMVPKHLIEWLGRLSKIKQMQGKSFCNGEVAGEKQWPLGFWCSCLYTSVPVYWVVWYLNNVLKATESNRVRLRPQNYYRSFHQTSTGSA